VKKKPRLNKKTIRNLKLKLKQVNPRKVAPAILLNPTNGSSCDNYA